MPPEPRELNEDEANERDMNALDPGDDDDGDSGPADGDGYQREEPTRRERPEPETPDPEAYLDQDRPTRTERRRARFDELQEERDRERRRADLLEAQLRAAQPQQPQFDPQAAVAELTEQTKGRLAALQQEQLDLQRYAQRAINPETGQSTLTQQEIDGLLARQNDIDFRRGQVHQEHHATVQRVTAPRQVAPEMVHLHAEYNDVARDPLGAATAQQYYLKALRGGAQDGVALAREAYEAARAELRGETYKPPRRGAPTPPRPTRESRSRFSGTSAGGGSNAGQGRAPTTISKEENELAQAAFKYEKDPAKRRQLYVQKIKRPAELEASRRRT